MVWVETTNEAYLVRSGYHLALSLVEMEAGTYLNNSQISKLWRHVWNIRGPNVVHMFLWKTCQNLLPTKENLHRWGILPNPLCPICGLEIETLGHILWSYAFAQDIWLECSRKK
jgi:hypothetical protein